MPRRHIALAFAEQIRSPGLSRFCTQSTSFGLQTAVSNNAYNHSTIFFNFILAFAPRFSARRYKHVP
jgi:hypothetical protein